MYIVISRYNISNNNMEILSFLKRVLACVGYLAEERSFRYKFCPLFILMTVILFELSCVVYFIRNLQNGDFENRVHAVFQVSGLLRGLATLLTIICRKDKVREVVAEFQEIFNKCNNAIDRLFCRST